LLGFRPPEFTRHRGKAILLEKSEVG
jgi:hypothetical protein